MGASFALSRVELIEDLLVPLMDHVGSGWLGGTFNSAHEHMATALIRSFVSNFLSVPSAHEGPMILITTPAGQLHEIGALVAAATATAAGWKVLYLGPNLPASTILQAAQQSSATAIALSITYTEASPCLAYEIDGLVSSLRGQHLIVGGRGATVVEELAATEGFTIAGSIADFQTKLSALEGHYYEGINT